MNLLIDKTPNFLEVGGFSLKIKTDFALWVRFLIASEDNNELELEKVLLEIFENIPPNIDMTELVNAIMGWLWQCEETAKISKKGDVIDSKKAFSFKIDGNIIHCELWQYFPELMKRGISFQEGMELLKLLMANENTMMYHRAFARVGDFSKMDKETRKYWTKERAKYALKISQECIDNAFADAFSV